MTIQWVDNKVVTLLSTLHSGSKYDHCKRHTKVISGHFDNRVGSDVSACFRLIDGIVN